MEESLIASIFKRRAIWDPTDKLRKNSKILSGLWEQVANEVGIDVKVAKSKWKNLRAYFVAEYRKVNKQPNSGSHGSEKMASSWTHFNKLMFIRDTLATYDGVRDGSLTTQDAGSSQLISEDIPEECVEELEMTSPLTPEQPGTVEITEQTRIDQESSSSNYLFQRTNINKRKLGETGLQERYTTAKRAAEFLAVEKRKVQLLEKDIETDNNPELHFFKSLLPYMADFNPIQKLRIRSKIQEMILNEHLQSQQRDETVSYSRASSRNSNASLDSSCSLHPITQTPYTNHTHTSPHEPEVHLEIGPMDNQQR